ncbi:hypothetical protein V8F33_009199 [Rhypophila sp. PSN 637]
MCDSRETPLKSRSPEKRRVIRLCSAPPSTHAKIYLIFQPWDRRASGHLTRPANNHETPRGAHSPPIFRFPSESSFMQDQLSHPSATVLLCIGYTTGQLLSSRLPSQPQKANVSGRFPASDAVSSDPRTLNLSHANRKSHRMESTTDTDSTRSSLSSSANYPQDAETTTTQQRVPRARLTRNSYRRLQTSHHGASPLAFHNRRICRDNHAWFTPQMESIIHIGDAKSVLHRRLHLCSLFRPDMVNKEMRVLRYVAILSYLKDEEAYYGDDEG